MNRTRWWVALAATSICFPGCESGVGPVGPPGPPGVEGPVGPQGPSFILALGSVDSSGSLIRATAVDGLSVNSARTAMGKYTLTISGAGAFTGVVAEQFVVGLTPLDAQEDNVLAATVLSVNADTAEIGVTVVDVEGGGSGTLVDDIFYFQVFLIP